MKRLLVFTAAALLSGAAFSQAQEMPPPPPSDQPPATEQPAPAPAPSQATEPAPSATTPAQPTSVFDALDADHDGKVGQQEAQAHPTVAEHFAKADANGDGVLTKEEFDATFKSQ